MELDLSEFPNLVAEGFEIKSDPTIDYNCIAWAADDNERWWEPGVLDGYWPAAAPQEFTFAGLIAGFATIGYEECPSADYEEGYDKVAFYGTADDNATHAAKQVGPNLWSSKCGITEDITHTLTGLVSDRYGRAMRFVRRRKTQGG